MIETHELTKRYGDFLAVDRVTLSVEAGAIFAILGPNGAGKTTTVRMLTSILQPTSGWARVAGYDVAQDPIKVRSIVGVLTEQHGLYERMKGIEYLDFFAQVYHLPDDVRRTRPYELMEYFGLGDALDRRLGAYSKGMKQKLALVRAMLHDPTVLLLDEPTSAMDPQSAKLVRDAIRELRREERTVAITTHNLAEAQTLADRIAVMRRGRIIANGTFRELSQRFAGLPLMEVRLDQALNGALGELRGMVEVSDQGDTWLRYRTPQPDTDNPDVVRRLTGLGFGIVTLSEVSRTLEDVYLQIVHEDEGHEHDAQSD
ncbi:MAG TPA: ABC transporter ATP-binding protein [Aggregatilinea sp.]|uniref:ABC transporter ATP-binding protein n=1 Tax=Aggregatilinea sp. TaxID=2806333 RepID=UPI002CA31753|nr:ABC transporter ATP-binding protein [Aggregatilinea sp.]HML22155.1 ABC transporter ATP-binding protein [Aggregatilinea sp.]